MTNLIYALALIIGISCNWDLDQARPTSLQHSGSLSSPGKIQEQRKEELKLA